MAIGFRPIVTQRVYLSSSRAWDTEPASGPQIAIGPDRSKRRRELRSRDVCDFTLFGHGEGGYHMVWGLVRVWAAATVQRTEIVIRVRCASKTIWKSERRDSTPKIILNHTVWHHPTTHGATHHTRSRAKSVAPRHPGICDDNLQQRSTLARLCIWPSQELQ